MIKHMPAIVALVVAYAVLPGCGGSDSQFVAIGTGAVTGVYYPVGGAIAKLINDSPNIGLRASVESTGGSVFNVNAILVGDLDFGTVQADKQYQAYHGQAEWESAGPQTDLRAVCSLHSEVVTLVAAVDSGIETVQDLRGKRVNIGNPGSGQRGNAIEILDAAGLDWQANIVAEGLKASEAAKILQDGRIDAFFFTVGHPNGAISEATAGRRAVRIVPIDKMDALIQARPYYFNAVIPIRYYEQAANDADVPSIGMKTTLVTSAAVPEDVVYAVTKSIFEGVDDLRAQHPALSDLTVEGMLEGLSAPIHAGALRYLKEAGLKD